MTETMSLAPEGFWMKSHFYREGNMLHVVTYSCIAGSPEVFRASVDIRPIIKKITALHNHLHGAKISGEEVDAEVSGFFSSITKAVASPFKSAAKIVSNPGRSVKDLGRAVANPVKTAQSAARLVAKVGKSKLVSQVGSAVKSVVKSKITGAALTGLAFAFPPVGAPAVAAYAAANAALAAIDQAKGAVDVAKKVVNAATPAAVKNKLKGELSKWAGATVKNAVAAKKSIPSGKPMVQAMKLAKDRADQAKKLLGTIAARAKAGDVEARKQARIITLAANARQQLGAIRRAESRNLPKVRGKAPVSSNLNGFPALLVSTTGRIVPGRYVERAGAARGVVLRGGKVMRGNFAAVSGLFGDDSSLDVSGEDMSDLIAGMDDMIGRGGHHMHGGQDFGSVGCSNPFTRPAHLR